MAEHTITPAGLNLRQAAIFLGVSAMTVRRMVKRGELLPARFGRRVVFPRVELERRLYGRAA
jgi:excisionase family DNA binding protein